MLIDYKPTPKNAASVLPSAPATVPQSSPLSGVLMPQGQQVRYNRWHPYDQPLAEPPTPRRYIREIIFG